MSLSKYDRDTEGLIQEQRDFGEQLALGHWREFVQDIKDPWVRYRTAILLENQRKFFAKTNPAVLQETTTTTSPGMATFDKLSFPMIRAILPNLIAQEIVSVQPLQSRNGEVFFLRYTYGSNKGATVQGTVLFENPDKDYSGEQITAENIGTGDGTANPIATPYALSYRPVRRNTVVITGTIAGNITERFTDNGAGVLAGSSGGAGTIDYATGRITALTFGGLTILGTPILMDYRFVLEGSSLVPEIDMLLTSSPVVAIPRKLRFRYSMEAGFDLKNMHNLDAESELSTVVAQQLKFDIDLEIVEDLMAIAATTSSAWPVSPGAGVSQSEYDIGFVKHLIADKNLMTRKTKRILGNFIIADLNVMNIIETLPGWDPSKETGTFGIHKAGTLNGDWTVYKNPMHRENEYLMGVVSNNWLETGYIYAPYIMFYTTPTITLDDFITRKGMATLYGKKAVDPRFYLVGSITAK